MAIEDYMELLQLDQFIETVEKFEKSRSIKAVLVDLNNTLIAWNNPDRTPEVKSGSMICRMQAFRIIVVSNNDQKQVKQAVEKLILTTSTGQ